MSSKKVQSTKQYGFWTESHKNVGKKYIIKMLKHLVNQTRWVLLLHIMSAIKQDIAGTYKCIILLSFFNDKKTANLDLLHIYYYGYRNIHLDIYIIL